MKLVRSSDFVKRQTKDSEFSHFIGTWDELEDLTIDQFDNNTEGYRDGVILVELQEVDLFRSAVTHISNVTRLETIIEKRRDGELPVIKTIAYGKKTIPKKVFIVLYRKDVLQEDPLNTVIGSTWEIVSVNSQPTDIEVPMKPITMARNQLAGTEQGIGGTKGDYSSEQFAESIAFWAEHIQIIQE
jgi:hypothetical protein